MEFRHILARRACWALIVLTTIVVCATMDGCTAQEADAQTLGPVTPQGGNTLALSVADLIKWLFLSLVALCLYVVRGMQVTQKELVSIVQGHTVDIAVIKGLCDNHKGEGI